MSQLPGIAQEFLEASREYNASSQAYTDDFTRVMTMLEEAGVATGTFAGVMDYQATLADVQTGLLQEILSTLEAPTPDLDLLRDQVALLEVVRDAIQETGQSILTVNSSVRDQTGHVISGNSLIDLQTGQIMALPRFISTYDLTVNDPQAIAEAQRLLSASGPLAAGQYEIRDAMGNVLSATVDQNGLVTALNNSTNVQTTRIEGLPQLIASYDYTVTDAEAIAEAQRLLSATGPLAAGQYAIQDATGHVLSATVDQNGLVTALNNLTQLQTGQIALGTSTLVTRTGEIFTGNTTLNATTGAIVQGVNSATGRIISGNSTSDAIRNLTARGTDVSEEMLLQLADNAVEQTSTFRAMTLGIDATVTALNTLIGLQTDLNAEEEAMRVRNTRIATENLSLNTAFNSRQTLTGGVNTAISDMYELAAAHNVTLVNASGNAAAFQVSNGMFSSDWSNIHFRGGHPEEAENFRNEFYRPGGLYEQTFGRAAELSALTQQITTLHDLIVSLGGTPSHAEGLVRVPYDNYYARLHADETVVDAQSSAAIRRYFGGSADSRAWAGGTDAICEELQMLRSEVRELREQSHRDMEHQTGELAGSYVEGAREGERIRRVRAGPQRAGGL
jgi:hypothetical protein